MFSLLKETLWTVLFIYLFISINLLTAQTGPAGVGKVDGSSTLEVWYRADAGTATTTNGATNTTWTDQSGNAVGATVNSSRSTPTFHSSSANSFPGITFDGSNTQYEFSRVISDDFTIICVFNTSTSNGQGCGSANWYCGRGLVDAEVSGVTNDFGLSIANNAIRAGNGNSDNTTTSAASTYNDGTAHVTLYTRVKSSGALNLYVDEANTSTTGGTTSLTSASRIVLGSTQTNLFFYTGDINEVMLYSAVLNSAERIIISNYLAAKYAATLSSNDIYLQDNSGNGNYDYEVAGIGRVDASNLQNAAQGTGIVKIFNPTNLGDNEFYIWGNNNSYGVKSTDVPSPVVSIMNRVWRGNEVNVSGTAVDVGSVDVSFDLSSYGSVTASDLRLLVDADNDGTFADETPISGATASGSVYTFSGVSSLANNLRFTLGTINAIQTPLPVELLQFKATPSSAIKNVDLMWVTASEINNDYFVIERSTNASDWLPLDSVNGAGNSNAVLSYNYPDNNPYSGTSYYRLKQVDFNGTTEYSQVEVVNFEGLEIISLFPNPSNGEVSISIKSSATGTLELKAYDSLGKLVSNEVFQVNEGVSNINTQINAADGKYFISAMMSNGQYYDYDVIVIEQKY